MTDKSFWDRLEETNDETDVRLRIARRLYDPEHNSIAQEWLQCKEDGRASADAAKRDAREDSMLSIARKAATATEAQASAAWAAADAARSQARWAKWAAIIAMIAAIISAKDQILAFIF